MIVPTESVKVAPGYEPSEWQIRKVAPSMAARGLIEPLKLDRDNTVGRLDPWDPARLEWAKRNNWTTVIVAEDWR